VLLVPVPYGEIADRVAILELKIARISDPGKVGAARALRDEWVRRWDEAGLPALERLEEWAGLVEVNAELWEVEDEVRICERNQRFDDRFVALARRVYLANDRRAALKSAIDRRLGSPFSEPKEHKA
jgi:hypothetical protein